MKTSINKLLVLVPALALLMTACNESDFLDLNNPNNQTETVYWVDEASVQKAMATVYSPIRGQMYGYYGAFTGFQNMNVRADDTWAIPDDPETWMITVFTNTPNTDRYDYGSLYKCIQRANVLLSKIGDVEMDGNKKNELIAEAKFLRGFAYFLLVTNYGQAPLRVTPSNESSEGIMKPLATEAELWEQVESDLKAAKEGLPVTRQSSEEGRVTKGAAIAYLGKSYIFQGKYQDGEAELKIIMQAPYSYDLVENPDDNFTEFTEMNKESIFEIVYDGGFGSGSWGSEGANDTQGCVLPNFFGPEGSGGWFKIMPSASLVDAFVVEPRPAGSDTKFDKRMYTSLYFKHSDYGDVKADEEWFGGKDFDVIWKDTEGKRAKGQPAYSDVEGAKGRFLMKKFTNFYLDDPSANSMYDQKNQNNNLRVMRFAEILLLHAEACIKTNKLDEAAQDLTRIRDRAGLAKKTWNGADELWKEMERQKLLELYFEGQRFFDLKRWYSYDEMKAVFVRNKKQGADAFQPKHFVLPIPQGELDTNTGIEQHPLWK